MNFVGHAALTFGIVLCGLVALGVLLGALFGLDHHGGRR